MKNKKTWMIFSFACILLGLLLITAGGLLGGIPGFYLDRDGIHTSKDTARRSMEIFQDTKELEPFDSMELNVNYADVELIPSDRYAIDYCVTGIYEKPVCKIENGRLVFHQDPHYNDHPIWFLSVGPISNNANEPLPDSYVKIEFPADKLFSDTVIHIESGNLNISDLQADSLNIENEYGNVLLNTYTGEDLTVHMSSGSLSLGSIRAERLDVRNDYGDFDLNEYTGRALTVHMESGIISFGTVQAATMELKDDYGDVIISQAVGTQLNAELSSGSFLADHLDFTDITVENEYGIVQIQVPGELAAYGFNLYTEYGSIRMDGKTLEHDDDADEIKYTSAGNSEKTVKISCESGDIVIHSVP